MGSRALTLCLPGDLAQGSVDYLCFSHRWGHFTLHAVNQFCPLALLRLGRHGTRMPRLFLHWKNHWRPSGFADLVSSSSITNRQQLFLLISATSPRSPGQDPTALGGSRARKQQRRGQSPATNPGFEFHVGILRPDL